MISKGQHLPTSSVSEVSILLWYRLLIDTNSGIEILLMFQMFQILIFQDPEGINMCNKLNLKLGKIRWEIKYQISYHAS